MERFPAFLRSSVFNRDRYGDLIYLSAQITAPVVGFIVSIVAARYVVPYELGVVQTVMLVATYCSFLHFGVFNGLNRNIAYYDAQQNREKIQKMVDASWRVAIINAAAGAVIVIGVDVYFLVRGYENLYFYSTFVVLGMLVFTPLGTHYETVYRSSRAFLPLGLYQNIRNLLTLVIGFLPVFFGVFGLIFRLAAAPLLNFVLLYRNIPVPRRSRGETKEITDLAKVGFPILITGVLYLFFTAADTTIAAFLLGPTAVGELALSGMIVMAIQVLPLSLGALLYPRASYIYGQTNNPAALRKFFLFGLALSVVTIVPVCLLCFYLIGPLTERFLPNYVNGIPAAKIYSLGSIFLMYYGISMIFPVLRRNLPLMIGYLIALAIIWITGLLLVKSGYGISGIAWARLIASGFLCFFTLSYSYFLVNPAWRHE